MDAPDLVLHCSTRCTTPTKERKLVESKLIAKPKLTSANSPNEHVDDVINIGEYNIDGAPIESVQTTTSMMTDVVAPSTERGGGTRFINDDVTLAELGSCSRAPKRYTYLVRF